MVDLDMKTDINPVLGVLPALVVLAAIATFVGAVFWAMPDHKPAQQAEQAPLYVTGICFEIGQPDLPDHTPALVIEKQGIRNMWHTTRANQRCRLNVNGVSVDADLDQIMVARVAKAPKSTH